MSDTPETDACLSAAKGESLEDLCRRLERERDEARAQNAKFCDIAERAINYMDPRYVYREEIRPEFEQLKEGIK